MAIHFFVNFGIFKWLYLAYYWVYLHQTWGFCIAWSVLFDNVDQIVANPIIYRLIPSPSRFENRQCHGFSRRTVVISFVEFGLFLIDQKQSKNFGDFYDRGDQARVIRHDMTMASSKMADH